ncbi:type II secretion system F family protein [Amycolatopsis suaedae]|uniref:Secretion system protein n=1 Tax=Amycolatopsis suaedae TaxID=2510978 RepID=A0A4V2ELH7_9PSEU|nr:type II secretion system F family protein [Amycolatopsis suaedae]RZQ61605.1 secretion system protein [Amycolatopsis suaedae]
MVGSAVAVVAAGLLLGPAGVFATGVLGAVGWHRLRGRRRNRHALTVAESLAEALRVMASELRGGAHPAQAAESASVDAVAEVAAALRSVSLAVRWGGDLPSTVPRQGHDPLLRTVLARLAASWTLAQRHGLALADVLDAVRRDVETGARATRGLHAKLAGPRASAAVLCVLPVCGVLLGEAMGARPLAVLAGTGAGQLLLGAGVMLLAGGLCWTDRMTRVTP